MGSMWVIVSIDVFFKQFVEVKFVKRNYIVEKFAPNSTDNPLGIWVLPGSLFPCGDTLYTGIVKKLLEISRLENGIIVVDDVFWCSVIWSRNAELLREPELIWRISDCSMNDSPCPMMNDDQNIQNSKR